MGQIGSISRYICCSGCCAKRKVKKKVPRTKTKTKTIETSWKEQDDITPSDIPDSQLTEEFNVPPNELDHFFRLRGYDFEHKQLIAKGGFGTVFKIIQIKGKKDFALKEILLSKSVRQLNITRDKERFKFLKNEIFIISKVQHKNIVQLLDHFIVNNSCYLIMEFANCGTVEDEIKSGAMPEGKAKTYFKQIATAIHHLHLRDPPIAHRDLKLANILVHIKNNEKILKVTDFGYSKVLGEKPDNKVFRTKKGEGTLPYMPPEIILLIIHYDIKDSEIVKEKKQMKVKTKSVNPIKADIWSLGVCLYYMVSAEFAFKCDWRDKWTLFKKQYYKQITPIKQTISSQLKQLFDKVFEVDTSKRIDIKGIVAHPWLSGVSDVILIKK